MNKTFEARLAAVEPAVSETTAFIFEEIAKAQRKRRKLTEFQARMIAALEIAEEFAVMGLRIRFHFGNLLENQGGYYVTWYGYGPLTVRGRVKFFYTWADAVRWANETETVRHLRALKGNQNGTNNL